MPLLNPPLSAPEKTGFRQKKCTDTEINAFKLTDVDRGAVILAREMSGAAFSLQEMTTGHQSKYLYRLMPPLNGESVPLLVE